MDASLVGGRAMSKKMCEWSGTSVSFEDESLFEHACDRGCGCALALRAIREAANIAAQTQLPQEIHERLDLPSGSADMLRRFLDEVQSAKYDVCSSAYLDKIERIRQDFSV
jgi:hypothetical protein